MVRVTKDGHVVLTTATCSRDGLRGPVRHHVSDLTLEFHALRKDARCAGADADLLRCCCATFDEPLDATAESGLTSRLDAWRSVLGGRRSSGCGVDATLLGAPVALR